MGARGFLRQLKSLSPRERQKVMAVLLAQAQRLPAHPDRTTRRVKWPDVEARAKRIFGDRVLPNLVLLEREEAAS